MRRACLVLAAFAVAGCDGADDAYPRAADPSGKFELALLEDAAEVVDGGRVAWHMPTGVRVTAQRVPITDGLARERSAASVADALVRRIELGEVEGDLTKAPCVVGGVPTTCVLGSTVVEQERYARRGFLLEVGDEIVLVETVGPERKRAEVDRQAELIERTFRLL